MTCLCQIASVQKLIAILFAPMKRLDTRRICPSLCDILMDSPYPNLVHHLSSCAVRLIICISPSASITVCMTATLIFVCIFISGKYLQIGLTWNYLLSCNGIAPIITLRLLVDGESSRGFVYFTLRRLFSF